MLLNVGLNFWLIPRYGALGTAMACLITQSVFALLCIAGTIKNNGFQLTLKRLLQLLLWSAAAEVVFGLWQLQGSGLLMLTAAGASWFIAVLLTGMFWPELKKFAKRGT
jgi:O-antigen/teichoic acid export membrane protein